MCSTSVAKLPVEFGLLQSLTEVDFSGCGSLEKLPESFSELSNLETLNLYKCRQLQKLPDSVSGLKKLKVLSMRFTSVAELSEEFGLLQSLTEVDFANCESLEKLPQSFSELSNLETLNLCECRKLQKLPDSVSGLKKLKVLKMGYTLVAELPEDFGLLQSLTEVDFANCESLEKLPESFSELSNLETLDISWCQQLQKLPRSVSGLEKLKVLKMGYTLVAQLPEDFGLLQSLTEVDFFGCGNLEKLPESFSELSNLETLNLYECRQIQKLPRSVSGLKKLKVLKMGSTPVAQLPEEFGLLQSLAEVDFAYCDRLQKSEQITVQRRPGETQMFVQESQTVLNEAGGSQTDAGGLQAQIGPSDGQLSLADLEMVHMIGKGAGGVVWLVRSKLTNEFYALKVIQMNIHETVSNQIVQELKINQVSKSQCSYVEECYHSFCNNGVVSIVLEYMDGGSLSDVIKLQKKISEPYLAIISNQVLKGLLYLHQVRHIIHCEIKPSNILFNHKGEVKISAFGINVVLANSSGQRDTFVPGTCTYMSPERILGDQYADNSDMWSLGLTLLECALGRFPYQPPGQEGGRLNLYELLECIVDEPPPVAPADEFSPEFCSFIAACFQKRPTNRPSAADLLNHPFLQKYSEEEYHLSKLLPTHTGYIEGGVSGQGISFELRSEDLPSKRLLGKGLASIAYETELNGMRFARKDFVGVPIRIFKNEAAKLVGLKDHQNVVKTHALTVDKMSCSLVLEYMDDDFLAVLQKRKRYNRRSAHTDSGDHSELSHTKPFEFPEAFGLMLQISRGMEFLHDQGILHGDLKTKNILVAHVKDEDKISLSVKVADFGLVQTKRKSMSYVSCQARKLDMVRWKAPEMLEMLLLEDNGETSSESDSDLDEERIGSSTVTDLLLSADVYSFAVTCFQILTGEDPYPNLNWQELVTKIVTGDLRPNLPASCPPLLRDLLVSCWSKVPAQRPTFTLIRQQLEFLHTQETVVGRS